MLEVCTTKLSEKRNINGAMKGNRGSATVEMCFIMPIIVCIIAGLIFLFLYSIQDGQIQAACYTELYTYTGQQDSPVIEDADGIYSSAGCLQALQDAQTGADGAVCYRTEYGQRTARLRRWQLYGDVLREQGN